MYKYSLWVLKENPVTSFWNPIWKTDRKVGSFLTHSFFFNFFFFKIICLEYHSMPSPVLSILHILTKEIEGYYNDRVIFHFDRGNEGTEKLGILPKILQLANDVYWLLIQTSLLGHVLLTYWIFYPFRLYPQWITKNYRSCLLPQCCSGQNSRLVVIGLGFMSCVASVKSFHPVGLWSYHLSDGNNNNNLPWQS